MDTHNSHRLDSDPPPSSSDWRNYGLNEILVLGAFGVFFGAILFLVLACVYAIMGRRAYFLQINRGSLWIRRREDMPRSRTRIRGLDAKLIEALPTFVYTSQNPRGEERLECTICLSEFEEGEKVRILPNCKHSFHVDCIGMWFRSHSNCPVCRIDVDAHGLVEMRDNNMGGSHSSNGCDNNVVVVNIGVFEPGQSSGGDVDDGSNSFSLQRESEEISSTNLSESARFSRLHSLKRILSRGREGKVFPAGLHPTPSQSEGNLH